MLCQSSLCRAETNPSSGRSFDRKWCTHNAACTGQAVSRRDPGARRRPLDTAHVPVTPVQRALQGRGGQSSLLTAMVCLQSPHLEAPRFAQSHGHPATEITHLSQSFLLEKLAGLTPASKKQSQQEVFQNLPIWAGPTKSLNTSHVSLLRTAATTAQTQVGSLDDWQTTEFNGLKERGRQKTAAVSCNFLGYV